MVGEGEGEADDDGDGDGEDTAQMSASRMFGGGPWELPESPVPQLQPSRSPSEIEADAAPVDAHDHPSSPLPCQ